MDNLASQTVNASGSSYRYGQVLAFENLDYGKHVLRVINGSGALWVEAVEVQGRLITPDPIGLPIEETSFQPSGIASFNPNTLNSGPINYLETFEGAPGFPYNLAGSFADVTGVYGASFSPALSSKGALARSDGSGESMHVRVNVYLDQPYRVTAASVDAGHHIVNPAISPSLHRIFIIFYDETNTVIRQETCDYFPPSYGGSSAPMQQCAINIAPVDGVKIVTFAHQPRPAVDSTLYDISLDNLSLQLEPMSCIPTTSASPQSISVLSPTCDPVPPECPVRNDPNFTYCLAGIDIDTGTVTVGVPEFGSIVCDTIVVNADPQSTATTRVRGWCNQLRSWKVQLVADHGSGSQIVGNPQWKAVLVEEIYYGTFQVVNKVTAAIFTSLFPSTRADDRAGLGYVSFVLDTDTGSTSAMYTYDSISMIEIYGNGYGFNHCSDSTPNCPKNITRYAVSHELMHIFNSHVGLAAAHGYESMGYPQIGIYTKLKTDDISLLAEPFYPTLYDMSVNNKGSGPYLGDRLEDAVELLNIWIWDGEYRDYSVVPLGAWLDENGELIERSAKLGFNKFGEEIGNYIGSCITVWASGNYCN